MKQSRLFEIVYLLLDRGRMTAGELAARFEVSPRTIYRDVETLSQSGIPILMQKGKNGGISLMPGFVLSKTVLTEADKKDILTALSSLQSLSPDAPGAGLSRLSAFFGQQSEGYIEIDFDDWGGLIKEPFDKARQAILEGRLLSFQYCSSLGEKSSRTVEPYRLWFKERHWYLKAYCLSRQSLRVFRFSRMRRAEVLAQGFTPRALDFALPSQESPLIPATEIVMQVSPALSHRVLDEFPEQDVCAYADGSFTVRMKMMEDEWLYGYLLSFAPHAKVISPASIIKTLTDRMRASLENYL